MYQQSVWNNFSLINCQNWYYKNTVMLEDAAHTIHFSVGSGISLALEDAQELSKNINAHTTLEAALVAYQNIRKREINGLCNVAHNSMLWFENVDKFKDLSPSKFVRYSLNRLHGSDIPIAQCSNNNLLTHLTHLVIIYVNFVVLAWQPDLLVKLIYT